MLWYMSISADNLVLLSVGLSLLALFFATYIIVDSFFKKKEKEKEEEAKEDINIKKDDGIRYVEEDSELEKTRAKLELEELKERLMKEEQEKQKETLEIEKPEFENDTNKDNIVVTNIDIPINLEEKEEEKETNKEEINVEDNNTNIELTNINIENNTDTQIEQTKKSTIREDVKVIDDRERLIREKLQNNFGINSDVNKENMAVTNINIKREYDDEEENAIISYEELKQSVTFGYTDEEMDNYVDEKDAIISISELEKLYKEIDNYEEKDLEEIKKIYEDQVNNLPPIKDKTDFKNTEVISPVYGVYQDKKEIEKKEEENKYRLNNEIKKTNEFLMALKALKKNLE